ncbi:PPE family protein [Mycobacterium haemophilum DSM 44634]|uniref:PPE family protein n=1 Tax=Mycobacterium haemophilum TaxID=29311 RepID=UPI000654BFC8|nr:PPE family protein [Mycobacterium haemophilum]AKN17928.1 hypothetical protein B586_17270 [Mycobacterium haemophilum DSM 44634]MCV7340619.1 PPE family protein [Mycobacterium haemophilum DSM 44634]
MDFAALPPEINSARMYVGPGSGPLVAAAAAWEELAAELDSAAAAYVAVTAALTGGPWQGPASISMRSVVSAYAAWMSSTAAQAAQAGVQAKAAAAAFEAAFAMTVPPPVIAANRVLLVSLIATNVLGQNTRAIAATEAHYAEMWAQDVTAMYGYAGVSTTAARLIPFTPPPRTASPAGLAGRAAAGSTGTHTQAIMSKGSRVMSVVPQALQRLASPNPLRWTIGELLQLEVDMTTFVAVTSSVVGTCMASISTVAGLIPPSAPALGSAVGGLSSGAGAPWSAAVGAGAGAVSAGLGKAAALGTLSVPPSWAAAAPAMSRDVGLPATLGAVPMAGLAGPAGMTGMPMATGASRGGQSDATPRYGFRPTVMARPMAAG